MNTNPTLTMRDLGVDIAVWFDRYDTVSPPRSQYGYRITDASDATVVLAEGTDLASPGDPNLPDALRSLLSFWSAAAESYDHGQRTGRPGENADLFPESLLSIGIGSDDVAYTASWLGGDA